MWRIVEEVPNVEEAVSWHATTGAVLQVKETSDLSAKLNAVAPINLGSHILEGVSPLVKNAGEAWPKGIDGNAAGRTNTVCGKSDGSLGVGGDFIPAPSGSVRAGFVDERGREGMVPDCRERVIDLRVMEDVVATVAVEVIS